MSASLRRDEYVICCKTKMANDNFCSCVMDQDGNQFRIGFTHPYRLSKSFLSSLNLNYNDWTPQRIVKLSFITKKTGQRITHPEDSIVAASSIELREILSYNEYFRIIDKIAKYEPNEIFGIKLEKPQRSYVINPSNRLQASVGYLKDAGVKFYRDGFGKIRTDIFTNSEAVFNNIPVNCLVTLEQIDKNEIPLLEWIFPFAIHVGITNPYRPESYDLEYCFLQFNGICFFQID